MANGAASKIVDWAPNEAPTGIWVGYFFACFGALIVGQTPFLVVAKVWKMDGAWAWLPGTLCTFLGFALAFALMVVFLRLICKTSLRDLVLGRAGTFDGKLCAKMIGAWFAGLVLSIAVSTFAFPSGGVTELNSIGLVPILANVLICLGLVWMQTTSEEIMFRCTFLRATCGDELRLSAKCLVWGVVASALFMGVHCTNPEVLTQGGALMLVLSLVSYFIPAFVWYLADIVYGNCLPGCVIHWINNTMILVFLSSANTAVQSGAVFVSSGSASGLGSLVGTFALYVPLIVMLAIDARKKRQQLAA